MLIGVLKYDAYFKYYFLSIFKLETLDYYCVVQSYVISAIRFKIV